MQERLQKLIARAGIASRRHAEQLIVSGQVRVNGRVVTELGSKADPSKDRIEAGGRVGERGGAKNLFDYKKAGRGGVHAGGSGRTKNAAQFVAWVGAASLSGG